MLAAAVVSGVSRAIFKPAPRWQRHSQKATANVFDVPFLWRYFPKNKAI
jgi:hypothetical protein